LLHIQLGDQPLAEPDISDLKAPLLNPHIVARDAQALLKRPDEDVRRRDLGHQGNQDVVVVGDRRTEIRVGRLHSPAKFAPEIELPPHVESHLPKIELGLSRAHP
jgi:hypothetical protein